MSFTLQLMALAGFVLAVIALHGWWRTHQARKRTVGTTAIREEPTLGGLTPAVAPTEPYPSLAAMPPPLRRSARLDALIDALATLSVEVPAPGEALLAHLPTSRRAGSKPFHIEGLSTVSGEFEAIQSGQSYTELQAGVQLANRSGALNEIEYSEFVQKVQAFADAVGASAEFPDMLDVVARARELDAFANPLDAQLTVTLRAATVAWSVGFVQQCAARHGFVAGALPGRLVLPSSEAGAPPLLSLQFDPQAALADADAASPLREVQLSLDVGQSTESAEPFPAWHRTATALAEDMDAQVVDDNGQVVTIGAYDQIGRELQQLYAALEQRDLAAGSAAARRLFSG
jgi:hypothetical protein